jgi:gas vesicle protein
VISAKGIDLDSLEEQMNRRLRAIWVRHTWFVSLLGLALVVALIGLTIFLSTTPTLLRVAVGPKGSEDVQFVDVLEKRMIADKVPFKLEPVVMPGPVTVDDIRGKPQFDLAVVRGNMKLSNDWPVVAILRDDVVALMVPPASAYKPAAAPAKGKAAPKPVKPAKIEDIAALAGKRIAIVSDADGGPELLNVILNHYGVPATSVTVSQYNVADLKAAVTDNKIDAVLVAGPQSGKIIESTVNALTHGKDGPSFLAIDQAEGIGKRTPPYESVDVPAGAFGGAPPMPKEELKTLSFPLYLVARKNLNSDKMAAFSKELYASRKALAYELPGVIALESPSTDKDASVLVHPGTADYLGDNTKTIFDKYGDWIFYGLLIGPIIGSALAGVAGYFRADKNTKRIRQLHRLLQLVRKARTVTSVEELDGLQDEADTILGEIVNQSERGQIDEIGIATFTLAIDQARTALSEQRSLLVLRPGQVPAHRLQPRSQPLSEEAAE